MAALSTILVDAAFGFGFVTIPLVLVLCMMGSQTISE